MKNLKKIAALALVFVMAMSFAACGGDPVAEEFENFLNVEMTEPNANYEDLKVLVGEWESFEDEATWVANLDECIANVEDSIAIVSGIELTTQDVMYIRDIYVDMLTGYQTSFEELKQGLTDQDDALIYSANTNLENALALLDDYNAALESLAAEKGMEIQY